MYTNFRQNLSVGGRHDGSTMLGVNCMRIPAKRVVETVLRIIELFREEKEGASPAGQGQAATLKEWIHAVAAGAGAGAIRSVADLKARLAPLAEPPSFDDDPGFYSDHGANASYHARTGKGECAA